MRSSLLVSIVAALSACTSSHHGQGCMNVSPETKTCPPGKDVRPEQLFLRNECGDDLEIVDVDSDGTLEPLGGETGSEQPVCCYTVRITDSNPMGQCSIGRPYREGGVSRRAEVRSVAVDVTPSERAAAWERAGAEEHASVAAFARLSLQLMAHGAPGELLRDVHRAALDEVGHAERCWDMARRLGSSSSGAGPFPFGANVAVDVTLAELARDAVREGCLGETLGAHLAAVAAELAPEREVRAELAAIAREEAEHAVLSYRIVAWALAVGGSEVRAAVVAAFATPWPEADLAELALRANVDETLLRRAAAEGIVEVLRPARDQLLAA
jgi:uncharacterized protein YdbL (DUF1318 family)